MTESIRLQGRGWFKATPVSEVKIGWTICYNYGYSAEVLAIKQVTAKTVEFTERSKQDGTEYIKRYQLKRSIVAFPPKDKDKDKD